MKTSEVLQAVLTLEKYLDKKPKNNADRIRSMSDEEMADFLHHAWNNEEWCSGKCPGIEESCNPCWLKWLKEECAE